MPRMIPVADHALMVTFADHDSVLHLDRALQQTPFAGFAESIPAMDSLLVDFDPLVTDHTIVAAHLMRLLDAPPTPGPTPAQREALICYEDAPDLPAIAQQAGLTVEAVIAAHLAGAYRVFMYGFAPGYAYLSGVPAPLQLARKPTPLRGVQAGSVIIAGAQCLITTLIMPTGWWIIGRSPTHILTGDAARPFLFDVGDHVTFRRITQAQYDHG